MAKRWLGLITEIDPREMPEGAAVEQVNLCNLVEGQLTVRGGMKDFTLPPDQPPTYVQRLTGDLKSTWAQTRRGDLIRVDGLARGTIVIEEMEWNANQGKNVPKQYEYPLGITAPSAPPQVTATSGGSSYQGKYYLGYRYRDKHGVCSSLSELTVVDAASQQGFSWKVTAPKAEEEERVSYIDCFRSTADQQVTLYHVGTIEFSSSAWQAPPLELAESYSDEALLEREALPILYADGSLCARRFEPPPTNTKVVTVFQDRAFYAVQVNPERESRNAIYYSERDEPESVPQSQNVLYLEDDPNDPDEITALIVLGPRLLIGKDRHMYHLSFGWDPRFDGAIRHVAHRGVLHQRAFWVYQEDCYFLDRQGAWRLTGGTQIDELSTPIHRYWREDIIDWSKSDKFFVSVEPNEKVARFHIIFRSDSEGRGGAEIYPQRALCYGIATDTWWMEEYSIPLRAAAPVTVEGRMRLAGATPYGLVLMSEREGEDYGDVQGARIGIPIPYRLRTGMQSLVGANSEGKPTTLHVLFSFTPTKQPEEAYLRVYWDHDPDPVRWSPNVGDLIRAEHNDDRLTVNLFRNASRLGISRGVVRWPLHVRGDPVILTHTFLTLELSGTARAAKPVFHALTVQKGR